MKLLGDDDEGTRFAGLNSKDVADGRRRPVFSTRNEAAKKAGGYAIAERIFLGKSAGQNATLQLSDATCKPRLELRVSPSGEARIVFLDASSKPTREIAG